MKKIMSLFIVYVFVVTFFTGCKAIDPNGNTSNTPSTNESVSTNETPNTDESVNTNETPNTDESVSTNETPNTVILSSIADKTNALVGELNKTYDYAFNDGNYSIKITSIKAQDEFDDGKNKQTNVILIEFVGDAEFSRGLSFGFYNKDGNLYREELIEIGYKNAIVYSSPDSNLTDFTKYIMISGLDADKNEGKTGVVFEVEK